MVSTTRPLYHNPASDSSQYPGATTSLDMYGSVDTTSGMGVGISDIHHTGMIDSSLNAHTSPHIVDHSSASSLGMTDNSVNVLAGTGGDPDADLHLGSDHWASLQSLTQGNSGGHGDPSSETLQDLVDVDDPDDLVDQPMAKKLKIGDGIA
jgi:hypothetical protein